MRPRLHFNEITADPRPNSGWVAEVVIVVLLVAGLALVYGARLGTQPIVGEESRYATGAREMLATGDWIVPRQQGRVFPERPPMSMWLIAIAGQLRGEVDAVAVRLPSIIAVILTSLLVYAYVRSFAPRTAALMSAAIYASMGQVLQIGRLGESEAVFTFFLSASLLGWHLAYMRKWPRLAMWTLGFALCAAAAMVKGPQAPVYFVAITAAYAALRREWRLLFCWQYFAGVGVFGAVIAAWQIPFYRATDWPTVVATWTGLSADRIRWSGAASHFVTYPLETFACLLPWSPLLVALAKRDTRSLLAEQRPVTTFLATALVVAYPSVWLAAGARGRYFMPLYPLAAALIGLIAEYCSRCEVGKYPRRAWHQFLLLASVLVVSSGAVMAVSGVVVSDATKWPYQPRTFSLLFALFAAGTTYLLWRCYRMANRIKPVVAILSIATFVGAAYCGIIININSARWNDPSRLVAELRSQVPVDERLVSFTPIEHRFEYFYDAPIAELDWPTEINKLPPNVDYFCFMRSPGDTRECRAANRGRETATSPGTLPFAWEEIASICVDRRIRDGAQRTVVLGRVVRPLYAVTSDATVPQTSVAQRASDTKRK